ncbi:hypothetical protein D3Z58_23240 [Clostridiaceae bacterium]|nr:hypothetical protein [Clostridiaceae bacterium]
MFAASTYEEIIAREKQVENLEIVVLLFVKPTSQEALDIIKEFEYIYYNSKRYCSIYAIGYSDDFGKASNSATYAKVQTILNSEWYFSHEAFVEFKEKLERRIKWEYSGEIEALVLQNNPGKKDPLNFQNYVAIDINKGLREGYIDSFQRFMESLIRSTKKDVTAKAVIDSICRERLGIKNIIASALEECNKIPKPVREIVKDRLFYRCANNMG